MTSKRKGRLQPAKKQSVAKRRNQKKSINPNRTAKRLRRATSAEQAQAAYALLSAAIDAGEASASTDEAHARYELPPSVEQRAWGAVTTRLLAEGVLRRIGDAHTRRRVAHGRRVGRYRATDTSLDYLTTLAASAARTRPAQRTLFSDGEG